MLEEEEGVPYLTLATLLHVLGALALAESSAEHWEPTKNDPRNNHQTRIASTSLLLLFLSPCSDIILNINNLTILQRSTVDTVYDTFMYAQCFFYTNKQQRLFQLPIVQKPCPIYTLEVKDHKKIVP